MSPTRKVYVTWSMPRSRSRQHQVIEIPSTATNIRCVATIDVEETEVRNEYIQVLLPGSSDTYVYHCPGAKIGDMVAIVRFGKPEFVEVVALGRGRYTGPTREATLVPR